MVRFEKVGAALAVLPLGRMKPDVAIRQLQ